MATYKRPLTNILDEIVSQIPKTIEVLSVVDNAGVSQTLTACDILYAQDGFSVTINDLSYKIIAFSQENETITVKPNFTGVATIEAGTIFDLYPVYFFHGTPVTTQTEISQIKKADAKTPMIWLWENYKERTFNEELIERKISGLPLYALTQPPKALQQMVHEDISTSCVEPMRRLLELLEEVIKTRTDLFYSDELEFDFEEFHKFGIIARNKGADKSVLMDNLSGVGVETDLQLYFKDSCPCPEIKILAGIDYDEIGITAIL